MRASPSSARAAFLRVYHPAMRLVLASASPRRRELMEAAGFAFDVDVSDVDEAREPDEPPGRYVLRLARTKAETIAKRYEDRPVIGADTVVVIADEVLGKPRDTSEARRMLERLSGQVHQVLTGVALVAGGQTFAELDQTSVWMSELRPDEIDWYLQSGEPMDKAGAYAIQGLASRFIPRIQGSYSNVVGLPVATLYQLLRRAGIRELAGPDGPTIEYPD
jgi:nucleoside triphosphate pyrophosphatase